MEGLTLDTGAPIAVERGNRRMLVVVENALRHGRSVTVPAPVVIEWWRGQRAPITRLLNAMDVEPLTFAVAKVAGEALASVGPGPSVVDAAVMASAALRGDSVYTRDLEDLGRLCAFFPGVRLFRV